MSVSSPFHPGPGQRAWVIGASHGIGAALCAELVASGCEVVASARGKEGLDALRDACGPGLSCLPMDVRSAEDWRRCAEHFERSGQRPDLVVYCAGTYTPMPVQALDADAMLAMVDTNLGGLLRGLPDMLELLGPRRQAHLLIVGSVAGYRGLPRALAYGASKAALIHIAEVLALELGARGPSVHIANPGFVHTRLTALNDFPMPAAISPEQAAAEIVAQLRAGAFELHFPRRFTRLLKCLQLLPHGVYIPLLRRLTRT